MEAIINACKNPNFPGEVVLVLSNKQDALGLEFARKESIKTAVINHKDFALRQDFDFSMHKEIAKSGANLVCLAGFMRLLSEWFVDQYFDKLINIHPSFLPYFKGAKAVEDAINAKAKFSGCTVHFVRKEMDSGPIILQKKVDILPDDTAETLAARILKEEHQIYPQAIKILCEKNNLQ